MCVRVFYLVAARFVNRRPQMDVAAASCSWLMAAVFFFGRSDRHRIRLRLRGPM